ncbi:MAG: metallophosphoesterase family protein [Ktedonobacterales bacterium]
MNLVHLSDTHLGYRGQGFEQLVEDPWRPSVPIRQHEADLMLGLMRTVDRILERSLPALVVHSGNLFDSARPSAHLLDFAMTQLRRLSDAGIPVVIVEGNQESPRDRSQGHVLRLLGHLPLVQVVCEHAERIQVGTVLLHVFPHRALLEGARPDQAECDVRYHNVLVAHGVADGLPFYRTGRPATDVSISSCASRFAYVALGHCHRFSQVPATTTAFYAGATAMITPLDFRPRYHFGFNEVTFSGAAVTVERVEIATRPMHAYGLDDASGCSADDVLAALEHQVSAVPASGAYCQVVVEQLDPLVRRTLSSRTVEQLFANAAGLVISLRAREQRWEAVRSGLVEGGDAVSRFEQLVGQMDGDAAFRLAVQQLGTDFLVRAATMVTEADLALSGKDGEADST